MVIKYALIGVLVAVGIFAYAKHEFVTDAFNWNPKNEGLAIPAFDPVARAKDLSTPPATRDTIHVAKADDSRAAGLAGVPADDAANAVAVQGGSATLTGTVVGPSGPVSGATVRIERFVGDQSGVLDVTTGSAGTFAVGNAPGGRYRVRAWRAPALAQLNSDVVFLSEGERHNFTLQLQSAGGRSVNVDWSASGWILGNSPVLSVAVNEPYVTDQGKVALRGSPGLPTDISVGGALIGNAAGTTNNNGEAAFTLRCNGVGPSNGVLHVGTYTRNLDLPACSPPPTTTTTTTTTTTQPGQPPAAPATTAPGGTGQ